MEINILESRPAGYAYLLDRFGLTGMPHWHTSFVSSSGTHRSKVQDGATCDIYPTRYWPGETVGDHLEFALKYDGTNLDLLAQIFDHISQEEFTEYIKSKPTGKYARRIWFFYEFLTGKQLPIDDITSGDYVDALEVKEYYTVQNGDKSPRHRIVNNLLGPQTFCPIIRRTETLSKLDLSDLHKRCEEIVTAYPPELLRLALSYLYNKETKSSFEIEHINPNASRTEKFITSLELAEKEDFCEKESRIELQNRIFDSPDPSWPEMILKPVGRVCSPLTVPSLKATRDSLKAEQSRETLVAEHEKIQNTVSEIIVFPDSVDCLKGIEAFSHILVLYWPHLIDPEKRKLTQVHPMGQTDIEKQGIFATCSPARPNPVLVSAVRLMERKENVLKVQGFEAVDNSPVIDIKPYSAHYLTVEGLRVPPWMPTPADCLPK